MNSSAVCIKVGSMISTVLRLSGISVSRISTLKVSMQPVKGRISRLSEWSITAVYPEPLFASGGRHGYKE